MASRKRRRSSTGGAAPHITNRRTARPGLKAISKSYISLTSALGSNLTSLTTHNATELQALDAVDDKIELMKGEHTPCDKDWDEKLVTGV